MGVSGQRHVPATLPPGMTRCALYRRLGGTQCRSGQVLLRLAIPAMIVHFMLHFYRFCIHLFSLRNYQSLRIYGPKHENGEWKSRMNRELEEMSKGENIVKWIKGQSVS
jgi:hypothetical protein